MNKSVLRPALKAVRLSTLLSTLLLPPGLAAPASTPTPQVGPNFQFGSAAFDEVAQTSYRAVGLGGASVGMHGEFGDWISAAYQRGGVPLGDGAATLDAALDARAAAIQAASGDARVQLERSTAAWAHRFIKKVVPKFSLERGFELANVVRTGERQCLAQSFIVSGLLQRAGLQAGAVMVWSNPKGQQSNLGHVVSIVRLSSTSGGAGGGTDLLVDASDPTPFMRHQGLLVKTGERYSFVVPVYSADDSIAGYSVAGGGRRLAVADTAPLTLNYLHSQFDYYRGERATGGILGTGTHRATPAGLKLSALYFGRALQDDPQNALATFMLGRVLQRQGQLALAKTQYLKANALYLAQGHVPKGVPEAIAALGQPVKAGAGKS